MSDNRPVGIFDSGVGGLTVLKEIKEKLPYEDLIYYGDTARVPYGPKSKDTILKFAEQIIKFLISKKVKFIVIACNTVSATVYNDLRKKYSIPMLGVIHSGAVGGVRKTKNKRIGVIGTYATIKSEAYKKAIETIDDKILVFQKATPLLVPLVEEGWFNNKITSLIIRNYLSPLLKFKIDTLVLGCTHYPLLCSAITKEFPRLNLIETGKEVAEAVREFFLNNNFASNRSRKGMCKYFVSDISPSFIKTAQMMMPEDKIKIEYYPLE